jgi:hypothetical protein
LSMESEKILERLAALAREEGCAVANPPTLKGKSGVVHSFSFLSSRGEKFYGVDVKEHIGQIEVVVVRIKQFDTGAFCCMISTTEKPGTDTEKIGNEFGIGIFGSDHLEELVRTLKDAIEQASGRKS